AQGNETLGAGGSVVSDSTTVESVGVSCEFDSSSLDAAAAGVSGWGADQRAAMESPQDLDDDSVRDLRQQLSEGFDRLHAIAFPASGEFSSAECGARSLWLLGAVQERFSGYELLPDTVEPTRHRTAEMVEEVERLYGERVEQHGQRAWAAHG